MYEKQNPLVALPVSNQAIPLPEQPFSAESARADSRPRPSNLNRPLDEELIEQLRQDDHDALALLFDRYHRLVLNVGLKILRDPGEAEDVMQEIFFEIYRKADQFDRTKGSAKTWILQYAYHRSLNRRRYLALRKTNNQREISELAALEAHNSPNGTGDMAYQELACLVRQGLAILSPKQRETLELAFFEGFLLTEIADRTKESLGNVRNHYYRALKKLRAFLYDGSCRKGSRGSTT